MRIVIPTKGRPQRLAENLRHLMALRFWEQAKTLHIVIGGPKKDSWNAEVDELVAFLQRPSHPASVRVDSDLPGLASQKNLALGLAQKSFERESVIFVDDDVLVDQDFLSACLEQERKDRVWRPGIFVGTPFCPLNRGYVQWDPDIRGIDRFPSGQRDGLFQVLSIEKGKIDFDKKVQVFWYRGKSYDKIAVRLGYAIGGALWVSQDVKSRFDTFFDDATIGEEIDFSLSVRDEGLPILYQMDLPVWHFPAPSGGARVDPEQREQDAFRGFRYIAEKWGLGELDEPEGCDAQRS